MIKQLHLNCLPVLAALIVLAGTTPALAAHGEQIRYVLTDAATNQHADTFTVSASDMPFDSPAGWSVSRVTLQGGKQDGVDLITLDNGVLQIVIIPTRGMNIFEVRKGDVRLGWDSPVKEIVHPKYINLESRGGLGWLDGFNEWMVRCGLEYAGHPGLDKFVTNTGDTAEMDLTLHGKIGHIPASKVEVLIDSEPPHRIRVRGVVNEWMFNGPKLRLVAEISTEPGSNTFRINDTVTNHGATEQEFQIIYHGNFGSSILEDGARFVTAAKSVTPMNAHAAKSVNTYHEYGPPTTGFVEEVFLIEPYADSNGRCSALLMNAAGTLGASVTWNIAQLPYLAHWKNSAALEDGYVTGIEPATGYPFNRRVERKYGRVPKLAPGESREFALDFAIHEGRDAVNAAQARVNEIRGVRYTEIIEEPPNTD